MTLPVVYRYSSQDARGTKLLDQYSFAMRSISCSSRHLLLKLLLIYGSVFVYSSSSSSSSSDSLFFCFSLRLPPSVHINFPWAISLRFHPVSFHAGVCCQARGSYIVPGATLLGPVLIWYTINRLSCYSQQFLHKPLPFYGFVFVFLSSSSPSFLFCFSRGLPPLYGRRACRRQLNMYNCVIAQIHSIYICI